MHWKRTESRLHMWAPAKLNLFLEVGGKRADGFHGIDSIFQAVTLYDELRFESTEDGAISLAEAGIQEAEKNIVHKAACMVRDRCLPAGSSRGVRIRLDKRIPQGAGLGGGSSDAASTLVAVSELWGLDLSVDELLPMAAELGSDVPFFLYGGTARCRGRGEWVESWSDVVGGDDPLHFVLVYPRILVSTKLAYEALDAARGPSFTLTPPSPLDSIPPEKVRVRLRDGQLLFNRFEEVVFPMFAELQELRDTLSEEPFVNVLMSGSGSTIYGLCRSQGDAELIASGLRDRLAADVFVASSERREPGVEAVPDQEGLE